MSGRRHRDAFFLFPKLSKLGS